MSEAGHGTVAKALDVLDQVAAFGRPVRFSDLLEGSPFPKATLYRLVQTLTLQGMLVFDADRQTYAPGVRLVRLAHAAWAQSSLAPIARSYLDRLSASVGETVHLAQLDNGQVLYVDKRNATSPIEMYSQAGKIGPAYCTGVGKAMLAFLEPDARDAIIDQQSFHVFTPRTITTRAALLTELAGIRTHGYAFDREEHEAEIICVAVPILLRGDKVLGALSVTSSTRRTNLAGLELLVPLLRDTARQIAAEAQDWRFPDIATTTKTRGGLGS
jgi:IclR family transcriptional regulator, KDG regulon repressor